MLNSYYNTYNIFRVELISKHCYYFTVTRNYMRGTKYKYSKYTQLCTQANVIEPKKKLINMECFALISRIN